MILTSLITALSLILPLDMGNVGRYHMEVTTVAGETFPAYMTVYTYDLLSSEFPSDEAFKAFLFDQNTNRDPDSLSLYRAYHFLNYPVYPDREEKLVAVRQEDWITLHRSDIERMRFISFQALDHIGVVTPLSSEEIVLFQQEPVYWDSLSIDAYQEGYSDLWIFSYNDDIQATELKELLQTFKEDYAQKTRPASHHENSWSTKRC